MRELKKIVEPQSLLTYLLARAQKMVDEQWKASGCILCPGIEKEQKKCPLVAKSLTSGSACLHNY